MDTKIPRTKECQGFGDGIGRREREELKEYAMAYLNRLFIDSKKPKTGKEGKYLNALLNYQLRKEIMGKKRLPLAKFLREALRKWYKENPMKELIQVLKCR